MKFNTTAGIMILLCFYFMSCTRNSIATPQIVYINFNAGMKENTGIAGAILEAQWKAEDGSVVDRVSINEDVSLEIKTEGIEDDTKITFAIYNENDNPVVDVPIEQMNAVIKDNTGKVNWNPILLKWHVDEGIYQYYKDRGEDILLEDCKVDFWELPKEKMNNPKYFFVVNIEGHKSAISNKIETFRDVSITFERTEPVEIVIAQIDGSTVCSMTDEDGIAEFFNLLPAECLFGIRFNNDRGTDRFYGIKYLKRERKANG